MFRKIFSKFNQTKPQPLKKPYEDVISASYYERVIKDLLNSKYCEVNGTEEEFIKYLLYKLQQNNLRKLVRLKRMSNKAIDFSYNSYPIGKIKLQGKKTWMQILTNLYDQKRLEDVSDFEYIDAIDLWISYIKKLKLNN